MILFKVVICGQASESSVCVPPGPELLSKPAFPGLPACLLSLTMNLGFAFPWPTLPVQDFSTPVTCFCLWLRDCKIPVYHLWGELSRSYFLFFFIRFCRIWFLPWTRIRFKAVAFSIKSSRIPLFHYECLCFCLKGRQKDSRPWSCRININRLSRFFVFVFFFLFKSSVVGFGSLWLLNTDQNTKWN